MKEEQLGDVANIIKLKVDAGLLKCKKKVVRFLIKNVSRIINRILRKGF